MASSMAARMAARRRTPVRLSLAEMSALLAAAGTTRRYASRDLRSATQRLELARERRMRAVDRAARP